jgi:dTDP-glucose 4,6-dehydratase
MTLSNNLVPALYSDGASEPDRFHIVGEREVHNDTMVEMIADILEVDPLIERVHFHKSRPGHDLRYALDGTKIQEQLHWHHPVPFEASLRKTVEWFVKNPEWLR